MLFGEVLSSILWRILGRTCENGRRVQLVFVGDYWEVISFTDPNCSGKMDENIPLPQEAKTSGKRHKGFRSFFKRMKKKWRKKEISTTKQGKGGSWCTSTYFPKCTSHNIVPEFDGEGTQELGCFWEQGCPAVLPDEVQSSHCYLIHFRTAWPHMVCPRYWKSGAKWYSSIFNSVTHDVATKAL